MLDSNISSRKSSDHNARKSLRIALLFPTVELGTYWKPVLKNLAQISQQVILYTGRPWPGFNPDDPDNKTVEVVGEAVRITASAEKTDYSGGYLALSSAIIGRLFKFKPQVIIASAFSTWTMLAIIFKPIGRWRIVLAWDGSSPNVDFRNSKPRLLIRKIMTKFIDKFIINNQAGKAYFCECLDVNSQDIIVRPYLVPDTEILLSRSADSLPTDLNLPSPVFLYVGRLEERKGIHLLLQSCNILHQAGLKFTLRVIGKGQQREELMAYCRDHNLDNCVQWVGWVDYEQLGTYFRQADIFVFPSLEDIWGMVVLEAMAFGKPVLSSKWAGATELIVHGQNGWVCDPHNPIEMAGMMQKAIEQPEFIPIMGNAAKATIAQHTPQAVAAFLAEVSQQTLQQ
jgi:glycosyltransferase involved in cell wall biosynthesis